MATAKKPRIDKDVRDQIVSAAIGTDWTPADIYRELESLFRPEEIPTLRSIERIVKAERLVDVESEPWSINDFDSDDIRLIFETRIALIQKRMGKFRRFTVAEAKSFIKILKVAPGLPKDIAWLVSQLYRTLQYENRSTEALDDWLAYAPWLDKWAQGLYEHEIDLGRIEPAPLWNILVRGLDPSLTPEERKERGGYTISAGDLRLTDHELEEAKKKKREK